MTLDTAQRISDDVKTLILLIAVGALLSFVAAGYWFKVSRTVDAHGLSDSRFRNSFSSAAFVTGLALGCAGLAGAAFLFV